jgi:hypothetical protein
MKHGDTYVVSEGGLDSLKRIQRVLRESTIESSIVSPPKANCSS